MANKTQKITLLNDKGIMGDNNPRLPDPSKIDYGQLAINYSKGKETLAIKNDGNEIVQFKDIKYIENIINNAVDGIKGGETESIHTEINNRIITSDLKLSQTIDNMVVINPDGVYVTLDLTYNEGELIISGSNGLKKSVNLPLESFLTDGQYYESYTYQGVVYRQVIVLIVRNEAGEEHPIIIPAGSLVNVYSFYGDSKGLVVTVTPSGSGDSNDYDVQITLKINPSSSNILVNNVNGLYVEDFKPYIAQAKQEAIDTAHQDAVNMDNVVIKHCETFATQEAQDAYDRATQFFLEWSNELLHITGGTMLGTINFVNGGTIYHNTTSNQYLSGSTATFESGSTLHVKDGTNIIFDCGVEINWCGHIITDDIISSVSDMMPKSGGTFYGPVIYGEKTINGIKYVSSNVFASGTTNSYQNGSIENFENGSIVNISGNTNYKNGSLATLESGSILTHNSGSTEAHKNGSIDNYESGSIVNVSGNTNYKGASVVTHENLSIETHNSGSIENYNSGSIVNTSGTTNYNGSSVLNFNSGSTIGHGDSSIDTYKNKSVLNHESGSTENYENKSVLNHESGSTEAHKNGSIDNYESGSILTHNSGSTESYNNGSIINVSGDTNYKGASVVTHENLSIENYNATAQLNVSGKTNYKGASVVTHENLSIETHNSGSTDTYTVGSVINLQGLSLHNNTSNDTYQVDSQIIHENGSKDNYANGSNLTHAIASKEIHESGSIDTYLVGAIVNFSGNTTNNNGTQINNVNVTESYDNDSTINNSGETFYQNDSTIVHNSNSTDTYNNGSILNVKSGATVTFDCGANIIWCNETLDEDKIKKWDTTTQSVGLNTTTGVYIPSAERFTSNATTVLNATTLLDKAIQAVIISAGFNDNGTYNKPNLGIAGSYISGSTTVKSALEGLDNHAISVNTSVGLNPNGSMPPFTGDFTSGATNIIDAINKINAELERVEGSLGNIYMPKSGGTFTGAVIASATAPFTFNGSVETKNVLTVSSGATISSGVTMNGTLNFPNTGNNITGNGSIHVNQGGFQDSDLTLKKPLGNLNITLDQIKTLSLIYFRYINQDYDTIGIIAQEIEQICPQIVMNNGGKLSVDYSKLAIIALKGVQLLTNELNEVKQELIEQKSDIKQIKELLNLK